MLNNTLFIVVGTDSNTVGTLCTRLFKEKQEHDKVYYFESLSKKRLEVLRLDFGKVLVYHVPGGTIEEGVRSMQRVRYIKYYSL